jgi:hypothetical protein
MKRQFLIVSTLALVFFAYQNCGVQKPSVENLNFASVGVTHTGLEVTCNECHSGQRPTSSAGFVGLNSAAPFDFAYHGGQRDCAICHGDQHNTLRSKADWAQGFFNHKITLTSCLECHSPQRPAKTAAGTDHPATGDCLSCHSPTLNVVKDIQSDGYMSMSLALWKNATGTPGGLVWNAANDVPVTVQTPTYNGNKILSSWTPSSQTLNMTMSHTANIPGVNMQNCTACHSNTNSFVGGEFHGTLLSAGTNQPTNCASCHSSSHDKNIPVPAGNSNTAFIGIATGVNAATNPSLFNHATTEGLADCNSCHTQSNWANASWKNGRFHKGGAAPSTCTECHAPTRPAGVVGANNFNHGTSGQGECTGCHISTKAALANKTVNNANANLRLQFADWRGAISTPTGLVGSQTLTVAAVKLVTTNGAPTGKTASNQSFTLLMNHANYQTNCATCHVANTFIGGKFHASQNTQPTSCRTCHTNSLAGYMLGSALNKPIDHGHSLVASRECVTCHTAPTAAVANANFKDGSFHSKITTQPTSCKECHSVKIVDQPVWGSMNHATIGSTDCFSCHKFPGTGVLGNAGNPPNWKGAVSGAPATISLSPPTGTNFGNLNLPHPVSVQAGMTCATCHGTSTANKIIGYDHANPPAGAKCVWCHYSKQTVVGVRVSTANHRGASATTDCVPCHRPKLPTWNGTSKTFTGGGW